MKILIKITSVVMLVGAFIAVNYYFECRAIRLLESGTELRIERYENRGESPMSDVSTSQDPPTGDQGLESYRAYSTSIGSTKVQGQPKHAKTVQSDPLDFSRLDSVTFVKSGMHPKSYKILQNYMASGAQIRSLVDLRKVYSVEENWIEKNRENFIFQTAPSRINKIKSIDRSRSERIKQSQFAYRKYHSLEDSPIDINTADSTDLVAVKGIGPYYAKKILRFREALGGFENLDQLKDTYGLPDSVSSMLIPHLAIQTSHQRIDVNVAELEDLASHPYINWREAKLITEFLKRRSTIQSLDELDGMYGLDHSRLSKMKAYFTVGEVVTATEGQ